MASKGNSNSVKVVVRVRPENGREIASKNVVNVVDNNYLVFDPKEDNAPQFERRRRQLTMRKPKDLHFAFDYVFDATATQEEVFTHTTSG